MVIFTKPSKHRKYENYTDWKDRVNWRTLQSKWSTKVKVNFVRHDIKFLEQAIPEPAKQSKKKMKLLADPDLWNIKPRGWNSSVLVDSAYEKMMQRTRRSYYIKYNLLLTSPADPRVTSEKHNKMKTSESISLNTSQGNSKGAPGKHGTNESRTKRNAKKNKHKNPTANDVVNNTQQCYQGQRGSDGPEKANEVKFKIDKDLNRAQSVKEMNTHDNPWLNSIKIRDEIPKANIGNKARLNRKMYTLFPIAASKSKISWDANDFSNHRCEAGGNSIVKRIPKPCTSPTYAEWWHRAKKERDRNTGTNPGNIPITKPKRCKQRFRPWSHQSSTVSRDAISDIIWSNQIKTLLANRETIQSNPKHTRDVNILTPWIQWNRSVEGNAAYDRGEHRSNSSAAKSIRVRWEKKMIHTSGNEFIENYKDAYNKYLLHQIEKEKYLKENYDLIYFHRGVYRMFLDRTDNNPKEKLVNYNAWSCCLNSDKGSQGCSKVFKKKSRWNYNSII